MGIWSEGRINLVKFVIKVVDNTAFTVENHSRDIIRCAGGPFGKTFSRGNASAGEADQNTGHLRFKLVGYIRNITDEYFVGIVKEKR